MAPKGQGQQDDVRPKKRQRGRRSGRRIQAAKAAAQRLLEEHQEEDHEESDRTESPPKKYRREDTEEAPARSSPAVELVAREVKHPSWLKSTPTKISEPAAPTKAATGRTSSTSTPKKPREPERAPAWIDRPRRAPSRTPSESDADPHVEARRVFVRKEPREPSHPPPKKSKPTQRSVTPEREITTIGKDTQRFIAPERDEDEEMTRMLKKVYNTLNEEEARQFITVLSNKFPSTASASAPTKAAVEQKPPASAPTKAAVEQKVAATKPKSATERPSTPARSSLAVEEMEKQKEAFTVVLLRAMDANNLEQMAKVLREALAQKVAIDPDILTKAQVMMMKICETRNVPMSKYPFSQQAKDLFRKEKDLEEKMKQFPALPSKKADATAPLQKGTYAAAASRAVNMPEGRSPVRENLRIAVDLHNVLDTDPHGTLAQGAVGRFHSLFNLGCKVVVLSYIGEENLQKRREAKQFVADINSRLARRDQAMSNFLSLSITDRRVGRKGKCTWLKANNYHYMIDDNSDVCKEVTRQGLTAFGITTNREKHRGGTYTSYSHVTEALDQCIELARQQRRNPATFQQPALAAPVRRVRRSRAVPSAALKASVLEDHNKIIESDGERTLRLINQELQKTINEDKPKKRVPFREPEYLRRTQARKEVRARFKGTVGHELSKRLPSPCSTCHDRRIRSTKAAVQYAAHRWRPKEAVTD